MIPVRPYVGGDEVAPQLVDRHHGLAEEVAKEEEEDNLVEDAAEGAGRSHD